MKNSIDIRWFLGRLLFLPPPCANSARAKSKAGGKTAGRLGEFSLVHCQNRWFVDVSLGVFDSSRTVPLSLSFNYFQFLRLSSVYFERHIRGCWAAETVGFPRTRSIRSSLQFLATTQLKLHLPLAQNFLRLPLTSNHTYNPYLRILCQIWRRQLSSLIIGMVIQFIQRLSEHTEQN